MFTLIQLKKTTTENTLKSYSYNVQMNEVKTFNMPSVGIRKSCSGVRI